MSMKNNKKILVLIFVALTVLVVIGVGYYFLQTKNQWFGVISNQAMSTYLSDKYKVGLKYPSGWIVKETDPYLQDDNTAQITFYKNERDSGSDIQKAAFTLRIVKNGDLKFGARDWQDLTIGTNNFMMNCEKGPLGGFATSCEIVPSTTGKFGYVIYTNNPDTDFVSKEMLKSFQTQSVTKQISEKDLLGLWSQSIDGEEVMNFYIGDGGAHQFGSYSHLGPFAAGTWKLDNGQLTVDFSAASRQVITFTTVIRDGNTLTLKTADGKISTHEFLDGKWRAYVNNEYGLEFNYPPNYSVELKKFIPTGGISSMLGGNLPVAEGVVRGWYVGANDYYEMKIRVYPVVSNLEAEIKKELPKSYKKTDNSFAGALTFRDNEKYGEYRAYIQNSKYAFELFYTKGVDEVTIREQNQEGILETMKMVSNRK